MNIRLRIVQTFDAANTSSFLALERDFALLESRRRDLPQGRRLCPIASSLPINTLIWEADFSSLDAAHAALRSFDADDEHEALAIRQRPLLRDVRIEFLHSF